MIVAVMCAMPLIVRVIMRMGRMVIVCILMMCTRGVMIVRVLRR